MRILVAAREILRESGDSGLSMKALADRACVSLMTPYNLIGSKEDIILQIFEEDVRLRETNVRGAKQQSAIEEILLIIPDTTKILNDDSAYVRAIMSALGKAGSGSRHRWMAPQHRWWVRLASKAILEGDIRPEVDEEILVTALQDVISGAVSEWVAGLSDIRRFEARCGYSFCLLLLGAVSEKRAGLLRASLAAYQVLAVDVSRASASV